MGILSENSIVGASGPKSPDHYEYKIDNSLRFDDDNLVGASAYLSRTPTTAGDRQTWTYSGWVKRGNLKVNGDWAQTLISAGTSSADNEFIQIQPSGDTYAIYYYNRTGNTTRNYLSMLGSLRDTASWYHIMVTRDGTTQKIYLNGTEISHYENALSSTTDGYFNSTVAHHVGRSAVTDRYLDGYLAEVNFIDGQALTPSDFGEADEDYGDWKPKAYTGTYGTNGFYLDFKTSGTLGNDASSNSNNWTPTNLAASDQMLDSPTNNFCTFDALSTFNGGNARENLSEGNLRVDTTTLDTRPSGSFEVVGGDNKYYWEVYKENSGSSDGWIGIQDNQDSDFSHVLWNWNASIRADGTTTNNALSGYTQGDILGFAMDAPNSQITFYKNGVSELVFSYTFKSERTYRPCVWRTGGATTWVFNFGQDSSFAGNKTAQGNQDSNSIGDFYYAPPSGFLALCSKNLPDPTVKPSEHFNTVLYTGTDSSNAITGVGFQPDFTWIKRRNAAQGSVLFDVQRGQNFLQTESVNAEGNGSSFFTSLDSDGFTVTGTDPSANASGGTFVAWNWKSGGTAVSNTAGSITSSVSANVDAGFSIVSYTGTVSAGTVGHGLSKAPEMIILKGRDGADNWRVGSDGLTSWSYNIALDSNIAQWSNTGIWNSTAPTSSVFSLGTDNAVNNNGQPFIGYAFHSVDGYSKVGSYTGNGSADGPFVHTGFRPAWIMIKNADTSDDGTDDWIIRDTVRDATFRSGNPSGATLVPNSNGSEGNHGSSYPVDILSNGFKIRNTSATYNWNNDTIVFLAFAEMPFKWARGR